jgi:protein-disulfide isomerase
MTSVLPAIAMAQGAASPQPTTPLQLNSLGSQAPRQDPFPPTNPKYFTASTPTTATVDAFLKSMWGYDSSRIWRVEAIQKTAAPGVSKVVVFVTDTTPNAKVLPAEFFITPDGAHALSGGTILPFGATPFAETRKLLQDKADGASRGASGKDLLMVEFADLQCPHCKEVQGTIDNLVKDFPNARVVFQSFPLVEIHSYAFKAAAYGYCVQKQKNDAFFAYSAAVFDTQTALTAETGDATLKAAVTKAGLDPAAIDACSQTQATKDAVNASMKLGEDAGITETPTLVVNGQLLAMAAIPYEQLKKIIEFRASQDGVSTGAAPGAAARTPLPLRQAPSLGSK